MKQVKFVFGYLKGVRWKFIGMMLATSIYVGATLLSPLILSFFVDNVINGDQINAGWLNRLASLLGGVDNIRNHLWIASLIVIGVAVLSGFSLYLRGKWNGEFSEQMTYGLRNDLYQHLQKLPFSYHVKARTGDLIQRVTSDVDQIRRFFAAQISEFVYAFVMVLVALPILFSIYPKLAWISLICWPVIFVFAWYFFAKMQKAFLASDEAEGDLSTIIQENLNGIRVVKAFNREVYELDRFEKRNRHYHDVTMRMIQALGMYWGVSDLICYMQILTVIIVGIFEARAGRITVGNFVVFSSYITMILWPIRNVGRILSDMGKVGVSANRLLEIMDAQEEDLDHGTRPPIHGQISIEHLSFRYDDGNQDVLRDVSFDVHPHETVAIMGPTGSGKSSLMHLLTALYPYEHGSIKLDGHELREMQKRYLRSQIGIVLQEPFLYSKTIYDNISIARPKSPTDQVIQAARMAEIDSVIREFDQGYDTLVGEKGVTLSGGQKQRIAIARTILEHTPIVIFDDSLSAVDAQTDAQIRSQIRALSGETTLLIITHRVNSAMQADKIIVLDQGRVVQQGTHEQLLQEDGLYRRIAQIQSNFVTEDKQKGGLADVTTAL